jgi:hypothetical protein
MFYKVKISKLNSSSGIDTYLTEGNNFAEAGYKIINKLGTENIEVEDICLMKTLKPFINEKYSEDNKLFIVKIAEDIFDNGKMKTIKYVMPVFANNANELQDIVKNYISQGLEYMRLTTISETKWTYI